MSITLVSETATLDLKAMLARVGGDEDLLREIASIFLDEYPVLLQEIREAVQNSDGSQLERAAHSLKGSVSNFEAADAVRAAQALENLGRAARMSEAPRALLFLESRFAALEPALQAIVAGEI
ncbi:MAG: Hpt domain-containing protein [Bryobacteraceae bacterium]